MYLLFNVLRATSRLLVAGAAGAVLQFLIELSRADTPEHPQWLLGAAVTFALACVSFTGEEQLKPRQNLHPESIRELRDLTGPREGHDTRVTAIAGRRVA